MGEANNGRLIRGRGGFDTGLMHFSKLDVNHVSCNGVICAIHTFPAMVFSCFSPVEETRIGNASFLPRWLLTHGPKHTWRIYGLSTLPTTKDRGRNPWLAIQWTPAT
jgi:hypothetical protein